MTRAEFISNLRNNNINEAIVNFEDIPKDGFIIRKVYYRWEVLYKERGKEYDCIGFPSESDALIYLWERLKSMYSLINNP